MNLDDFDRDSLKVLSHALPLPSSRGNVFPSVIDRIINQTAPNPTTWINVFHAVPGRFTIADLPTSPPTTPGQTSSGEDYFTSKVFDTAVAVSDYSEFDAKASPLPKSPRPVVPPSSVNLSIIERYIPPPTPGEAKGLFTQQHNGQSLLVDRLTELSSDNGLLFLIYPTKTGARTFMNDYLGPILEPLLRSMSIINSMSSDLGTSLHKMVAVEHLIDYGELKASVEHFCRQMSANSPIATTTTPSSSSSRKSPMVAAQYNVMYAARHEVMPDRATWSADWWGRQEKARVRATVSRYIRQNPKAGGDKDIVPTAIVQEILDGVEKSSRPGWKPSKGLEVGVFIIKKTAS
jgi:hypothetical protein